MAKKTQKAGAAKAAPAIKNETKPIEKIEDSAAAAKQPVEESEKKPAETQQPKEETKKSAAIVVFCYNGTADLMKKIWAKAISLKCEIVELEADEPHDLLHLVSRFLVMENMPEDAVIIAPNTIPCARVDIEDLLIPTVYISRTGAKSYDNKLPFLINADKAMEMIEITNGTADDIASEAFARGYVTQFRQRPVEVGFSFGNYVCPIESAQPCGNKVIEALIKKKWLTTSPAGFKAIIPELTSRFKLDE